MLELLQSSSGTRTVAELAARLEVDERTVRRYVAHLVDLDVPVQSVRGPYGGVRLGPGHRMPPLMLTDEEALVVLLGLVTAHPSGVLAASPGVVDAAVSKLRRVLPVAVGERVGALVQTAAAAAPRAGAARTSTLLLLARAVHEHRPVALTRTAADGGRTLRTVHPFGVVARSGRWYLCAADPATGAVRTFRVDRIDAAEVLAGSFDVPDGFSAADHVRATLSAVPWRHEVSLRVRGTADEVERLFPPGLATTGDASPEPGWVRVTFRAERLDWVPGLLAALPVPFVVDGPEALRDLVRSLAARLLGSAGGAAAP
nr:WYL domain-containing protein [Kineococcus aurantiacus]